MASSMRRNRTQAHSDLHANGVYLKGTTDAPLNAPLHGRMDLPKPAITGKSACQRSK